MNILISTLAVLLFCHALHAASAPPLPSRPNILFIMSDDQGPWAVGDCGGARSLTPNLDRLAREGARFQNAFAPTPVCSPSRAGILTSRYGTELGITDWINPQWDHGLGLDPKHVTWPKLLLAAGYQTALFGKWHLGDQNEQHATRHGYQTFAGFRGGSASPLNPSFEKQGVVSRREGYIVDIVAEEAMEWLKQRDPAKPFAASVHFREPHANYLPVRDEDWEKVTGMEFKMPNPDLPGLDTDRVRKTMREYLAAVAAIDRNVGRILDSLDQLNLSTNTIVIYTSDHGYNVGHHGLLYKGNAQYMLKASAIPAGTRNVPKGQRPNLFDTSLKVPMFIRWPGVVRPGFQEVHTISHLDWLPTFAHLAGAKIPSGTVVRGRDISPLLQGTSKNWNDDFYAEYSMKHGAAVHLRALRTTEWKLVRDFINEGRDELYHLSVDPDEATNLITDQDPKIRQAYTRLNSQLLSRMKDLKDPALKKPAKPVSKTAPKPRIKPPVSRH